MSAIVAVRRGEAAECEEFAAMGYGDLASDDLALGSELELPGYVWAFPLGEPIVDDGGALVLRGGPLTARGWVYVDISDPLDPQVERYATVGN